MASKSDSTSPATAQELTSLARQDCTVDEPSEQTNDKPGDLRKSGKLPLKMKTVAKVMESFFGIPPLPEHENKFGSNHVDKDDDFDEVDEVDAGMIGSQPGSSRAPKSLKRLSEEELRRMKWHHRRLRHSERRHDYLKEPIVSEEPTFEEGEDQADTTPASIVFREKPTVWQYAKETTRLAKDRLFAKKIEEIPRSVEQTFPIPTLHTDDVDHNVLQNVLDRNEARREFGIGFFGELLNRRYNEGHRSQAVRKQIEDLEDYRPYFTYWISTVQIVVMIIALCWYGMAPFGVELKLQSDFVRTETLTQEHVAYYEPPNFWVGPRAADLIRLGSKFSPCMRNDPKIANAVQQQRLLETEATGCCVRNDGSG